MTHTDTDASHDYPISGMTCAHCALSVRDAVSKLGGVSRVDVDLARGRLSVRGDAISDAEVKAAVAEAGYEVAS